MAQLEPAGDELTSASVLAGGQAPRPAEDRGALPRVIASPGDPRALRKPAWASLLQSSTNATPLPQQAAPAASLTSTAHGRTRAASLLSSFTTKSSLPAAPGAGTAPAPAAKPPAGSLGVPGGPGPRAGAPAVPAKAPAPAGAFAPAEAFAPAGPSATAASAARALCALAGASLGNTRAATAGAKILAGTAAAGTDTTRGNQEGPRQPKSGPAARTGPPAKTGPASKTGPATRPAQSEPKAAAGAAGVAGPGHRAKTAPSGVSRASNSAGARDGTAVPAGDVPSGDILPAAKPKPFWRFRLR